MSLIAAKVSLNGKIRSFLLEKTITPWTFFEAEIRRVFNIPANSSLAVTYTDSDGDVISLDTDAELAVLIAQLQLSGTSSIRFDVTTNSPTSAHTPAPDAFVMVADRSTSSPRHAGASDSAMSADEPPPAAGASPALSTDAAMSTEPATAGAEDKGKAPEQHADEGSAGGAGGFDTFVENLQPLLATLKEEFDKSGMKPIIEKIAQEAETHLAPAFEEMLHQGPMRGFGCRGPFAFGGGCPADDARGFRRWAEDDRQAPLEPRWHRVTCDGCNSHAFVGGRHRCTSCADFDLCDGCFVKAKDIHNSQHVFDDVTHPAERRIRSLLDQLAELGFFDEARCRELLVRYGGNVNRVVEILLRDA